MSNRDRDRSGRAPALVAPSGRPGGGQPGDAEEDPPIDGPAAAVDGAPTEDDQSLSDADQTLSDTDQDASESDQGRADVEQRASDDDQAVADREHVTPTGSSLEEQAYQDSREDRANGTVARLRTRLSRLSTAAERDRVAAARDRGSIARDRTGQADQRADELLRSFARPDSDLIQRLAELNAVAARARARAAREREQAAAERLDAARVRARLEAELRIAHLDHLTGAYRREMGELALHHEIDRARRLDGRFVLAFLDIDGLKAVNDRDGHAAGDEVLQAVAYAVRSRLRTFDPFVRYGGDEFLCGLGGVDLAEADLRFTEIERAIQTAAKVGVSIGLADLQAGDTVSVLTERADTAMLQIKAQRHMRA